MPTGAHQHFGRFSGLTLPRAVADAVERLGDGRIVARSDDRVRTVWFGAGRVHALTSGVEPEMLGGWLIQRGLVDAATVQRCLVDRGNGARLGQILVRAGVINGEALREELFHLACTIAARLFASGGTIDAEAGAGMPSDARTLDVPAVEVFAEAMLHTPDIDLLAELVGQGTVWEAAGDGAAGSAQPSDAQRYLLSLLRPPKTLDALRRVVLADYAEVVRDLAFLAAAGLVVPRGGQPPAPQTLGDLAGGGVALAQRRLASSSPALRTLVPTRSGSDPRLRATLAELEKDERELATREGFVGRDGVLSGPELRRAERLLAAAEKQLEDCDPRGARRALAYAVETVPCAALLTRLGEIEISDPGTRHGGLQRLKQALALAPDYVAGWLVLASYWRQRGELDKERRCLEKVLAVDPDEAEATRRHVEIAAAD